MHCVVIAFKGVSVLLMCAVVLLIYYNGLQENSNKFFVQVLIYKSLLMLTLVLFHCTYFFCVYICVW